MGTRDFDKYSNDSEALDWARQSFPFDRIELVTAAAWATSYRLAHGRASAYLKVLPARFAGVAGRTQALAKCFSAEVPRVVACDARHGWLLSLDHGGSTLDYDSPDAELRAMIESYARLQARAAQDRGALAELPRIDIPTLPQRLLDFLDAGSGEVLTQGPVQADYFLGKEGAAHARQLLLSCKDLLQDFLQAAAELPPTLNHGDLRPPNAALLPDGRCVLVDWDDALVGPAGLSLHGMFSGCTRPIILLTSSAMAKAQVRTPAARSVQAYVDTLVRSGYASRATLMRALPASICAGMMQFILHFAHFPGESNRDDVRDTVQSLITDLLDLCDWLATRTPGQALARAAVYEAGGDWRRALALLQDQLARNPRDRSLLVRVAEAARHEGNSELAEQMLREAVRVSPQDVAAHSLALLGQLLLERLDLARAGSVFRRALARDASCAEAQAGLARITAIRTMRRQAAQPKRSPVLRYEPGDAEAGRERPEYAALGAELFNTYGMLQIDNAFPVELIQKLQTVFFERYSAYFQDSDHPDALHVGDKRYMLTVDIEDPFDDPRLLGSATVLPIIQRILGDEAVLGAFTAVISLPGSRDQQLHKDHPALFPDTRWHFDIPPFSSQIIIPLIPLDEFSGTTRFYKGSHKVLTDVSEALGHQDAMVPLGSCLLNDYRCAHRGLGNRSDLVRPILTLVFNRPWFHDYKNYGRQPPLRLPQASYDKLPPDLKPLLAWWMEEKKVVKQDQFALR
jgi:tetratricopeptide (TPR) repeat protein